MVFGWGKKKQESNEAPNQQNKTITLDEIKKILSDEKTTKQKNTIQQTKPRFEEIQKEMNSIAKIISHLESDDLKVDDIDRTLKVLVVRSKSEIIDVISKESNKTIPKVSSYDDVLKASETALYVLKKIGDVLGKNSRIVHVFAKKYAQDLKNHLGNITENTQAVSHQINSVSAFASSSDAINGNVDKISQLHSQIIEKKQHLLKLEEFHSECVDVIGQTEQKISSLRSSPEFSKHLEYKEKIKHAESDLVGINKEIDDELSKISRPLGKYVYVTSLEKPQKQILESLIANHSETISSENRDSIVKVLESCMKGIISGSVSVKESEKSVDQITNLISSLDDFIARKDKVNLQIIDLKKSLSVFDVSQLEDVEKRLDKAKFDKDDTDSKISSLQSDIEKDELQMEQLLSEIQNSLEKIIGVKYDIQIGQLDKT